MNKQGAHGIEWTDYTWNPITGCLNGCEYCYARKLANGRLKPLYLANKNYLQPSHLDFNANRTPKIQDKGEIDPFYPRIWPERIEEPLQTWDYTAKPRKIFVCDMGELFGGWVPREWQEQVFRIIKQCPQNTFQLLTKQPQNLAKWSPFPENCHVGATATNQNMYDNNMLYLGQIEAKVKFMSFEPLLQPIDISFKLTQWVVRDIKPRLDWLIIGQQTPVSAKTQPKIEWVQEIVQAADKAGIPVFLKENLKPLMYANSCPQWAYKFDKRGTAEYLRQEFPC